MSLGIFPVLNPRVPGVKFDGLGEVLADQFETLDQIAVEHGITPLSAFADTREIPPGFDGPPEDLAEILGPWEEWFACRDGRAAMEALARLVGETPQEAQRLDSPDQVVAELRAIVSVLEVGESHGSQIRLEMG